MQTSPSDVIVGTILDDTFEIVRPIGSGGFAVVYEARHLQDGSLVAIKLLDAALRIDPLCGEQLVREAAAMARVQHPNSVEFVTCGETDDGVGYLVTELVDGVSLAELAERAAPLPLERMLTCFDQVLAGLAASHEAGVVHGDVKPSNVLVERGDLVKLIDFGNAASRSDAADQRDAVCGTPAYMAPELARGHAATVATDIYAAGVMLFELVTGRLPFDGEPLDVLVRHIQEPVPDASELGASTEIAAIIRRAMAKRPRDRFASADEMRLALASVSGRRRGEVYHLVRKSARPSRFAQGSHEIKVTVDLTRAASVGAPATAEALDRDLACRRAA